MKPKQKPVDKAWAEFDEFVKPTQEQRDLFERYAAYLLECNQFFNLTAITDVAGVLRQHFEDSVALAKFMDMTTVTMIADIGTGAGFPALPLKIMFPHLKVLLVEVTHKKREFLTEVIKLLKLEDVEVCPLDWRTLLRTTSYPADLFVTRAALEDLELIRMFKPACPYNNATLVYWASKDWEAHPKTTPFIKKMESYRLGYKDRRLAFLGK